MPTSLLYQISQILELIVCTNPKKILDVGVGFGKYGLLSREYLDIYADRRYSNWERRIDGIEAFKEYITPVHDYIYDNMYIGNALDILPELKDKYDLVLLIDVLEHFEYEEGKRALDLCNRIGRNMIVSTPKHIGEQGAAFGNSFETHRSQWSGKDFNRFDKKFSLPDDTSLIYYIGKDHLKVRGLVGVKYPLLRSEVGRRFPFVKMIHSRLVKKGSK